MSDYDRGSSSRRRGVLTHWVPLVLTLTIATAGVAAWAWSQRNRDDDDEYEDGAPGGDGPGGHGGHGKPGWPSLSGPQPQPQPQPVLDYDHADYGDNPPYGKRTPQPQSPAGRPEGDHTIRMAPPSAVGAGSEAGSGWGARVTGALGGATSPQQWVGSASKAVTAGLTAASAAVGGALASIREGDKDAYADHETWSEEADARKDRPTAASAGAAAAAAAAASVVGSSASTTAVSKGAASSSRKRKTVAIVVSADHDLDGVEDAEFEHASILSYIPRQTDFSRTRVFVLIYAPGFKDAASLDPAAGGAAQPNSLSSSFSNIGAEAAGAAQSPPQEAAAGPRLPASVAYNALHAQALALVEKETEIIPFTTPSGHAHILHLLNPDYVYLQESLAGDNGVLINQLQNWMRNDIVVVVGAESGYGAGLADSESEAEKPAGDTATVAAPTWWQREDRVGRGRGVVVVDGLRVNDDWIRRVQGRD